MQCNAVQYSAEHSAVTYRIAVRRRRARSASTCLCNRALIGRYWTRPTPLFVQHVREVVVSIGGIGHVKGKGNRQGKNKVQDQVD